MPTRRFYDYFYEKYQELDTLSENCTVKFNTLSDGQADFVKMSKNLIQCVKKDAKASEVLFGKTKIFMSNEFHLALEKALEEKVKYKKQAVAMIAENYRKYIFYNEFKDFSLRNVKRIQLAHFIFGCWNSACAS